MKPLDYEHLVPVAQVVARLGGTVHGQPTSALTYLERIDELRQIERDAKRARVKALEDAAAEIDRKIKKHFPGFASSLAERIRGLA